MISDHLTSEVEVNKADHGKLADGKTQRVINDERTVESALPQGRGESLVAQVDSAVNQAEQLRDQQVQQEYNDQLGIYVQENCGANRPAAIQPGGGVNLRPGAVASHCTETAGLDGRQKSARSMGGAGCATKDQDRADCAALG